MLDLTMSPQVNEIAAALAKAQAVFPVVKKESKAEIRSARGNYEYHYASLAAVIEAIRGPLAASGITYTQPIEEGDGVTYVTTLLIHTSGQWLCSRFRIPTADLIGPQAIGSYIGYARRYAITALTGVAIEDDDGRAAQRQAERAPSQQRAPEPVSTWPDRMNPPGTGGPTRSGEGGREPGCDDQPARPNGREPRSVGKIRTGEWLAQAADKQGLVDEFTAIGKRLGYPLSFKEWTPQQVANAIQWRKEKLAAR